jgi:hypothetical protein
VLVQYDDTCSYMPMHIEFRVTTVLAMIVLLKYRLDLFCWHGFRAVDRQIIGLNYVSIQIYTNADKAQVQ